MRTEEIRSLRTKGTSTTGPASPQNGAADISTSEIRKQTATSIITNVPIPLVSYEQAAMSDNASEDDEERFQSSLISLLTKVWSLVKRRIDDGTSFNACEVQTAKEIYSAIDPDATAVSTGPENSSTCLLSTVPVYSAGNLNSLFTLECEDDFQPAPLMKKNRAASFRNDKLYGVSKVGVPFPSVMAKTNNLKDILSTPSTVHASDTSIGHRLSIDSTHSQGTDLLETIYKLANIPISELFFGHTPLEDPVAELMNVEQCRLWLVTGNHVTRSCRGETEKLNFLECENHAVCKAMRLRTRVQAEETREVLGKICVDVFPISQGDDIFGAVELLDSKAKEVDTDFEVVLALISLIVKSATLFSMTKHHQLRAETMLELTTKLASTHLNENTLVPQIIGSAKRITNSDRCSLFIVDNVQKELVAHFQGVRHPIRMPIDAGIAGYVATTGMQIMFINQLKKEENTQTHKHTNR